MKLFIRSSLQKKSDLVLIILLIIVSKEFTGLTLIRSMSGEEGGCGETGEGVEQVVRSVRWEETSRVWHKLPASVSLSSSKLLSQSLWPGHWSAPRLGTRKVVSSKLPGSSRAVRGLHV